MDEHFSTRRNFCEFGGHCHNASDLCVSRPM